MIFLLFYYQANYAYRCDEYLANAFVANCNETQLLFLEFDTSSIEKTFGTSAIFLSFNRVPKDSTTSEIHINIVGKYAIIRGNKKLHSSRYVVLSEDDFLTKRTYVISGYSHRKILTIYKINNKLSISFDSSEETMQSSLK